MKRVALLLCLAAVGPAQAQPRKASRTCYACGFEGPSADYERSTLCPQCDAPWS